MHAAMAQIPRQMRQEALYVLTFAVPTDETIHRERVAEVVQARPTGAARWALQARLLPPPFEYELGGLTQDGPTLMIRQESIVQRARSFPVVLLAIAPEDAG